MFFPPESQEGPVVNAFVSLTSRFFQITLFLVCNSRNNFLGCLFFQAAHGSDFVFGCFPFALSWKVPSLACAVCQLFPVENTW